MRYTHWYGVVDACHTGLLELFYGVYEKDPDRCLDALVDMGVLVPSADRQAVRRTAEFFLASFQDRLKAQKEVGGGWVGIKHQHCTRVDVCVQ